MGESMLLVSDIFLAKEFFGILHVIASEEQFVLLEDRNQRQKKLWTQKRTEIEI